MKRIFLHLITNVGVLMLDATTLLTTAAVIGLASSLVSLALSRWSLLRSLPYS
jgi:hypothetical protein